MLNHDWLMVYLLLWKIWVSWDNEFSQYDGKHNPNVPNHQPDDVFKPWLKSSRNTGGPLHALGGVFSRGCGVFARGGVVARDGVFARGGVVARGGVFARVAPALRWANILCNLTTHRSNKTVILTSGFSFWSVRREQIFRIIRMKWHSQRSQ